MLAVATRMGSRPLGLLQLRNCSLRRRSASDVAANNPFNLIFAPCQNLRNHADWQAGDIEFCRGSPAQVVKVQILVGKTGRVLCVIER